MSEPPIANQQRLHCPNDSAVSVEPVLPPQIVQTPFQPNPRFGWLMMAITLLIWSGFTLLSRMGAGHSALTAWDIGALRFVVAAMILIPVALWRGNICSYLHVKPMVLAVFGGMGYACLAYLGFAHAPAAHAAIWLNGFLPLVTALGAWALMGERPDRDIWISLAAIGAGLLGMAMLMEYQGSFYLALGDVFFIAAAVCWGVYTGLLRRWQMSPWDLMSAVAINSAWVYLPIYWLFLPKGIAQASIGQIVTQGLFQGIMVVIVAMLTYVAAIRHLGAFRTGSVLAMAPLLAAVAAVSVLNEPLTPPILVGIAGMMIGAIQPWRFFRRAKV
jgi:drug/metabolite transporter (DMT)-like permease